MSFNHVDLPRTVRRITEALVGDQILEPFLDKIKLSVHLNGKPVEELTQLVPKADFIARARALADGLAKEIPRQQFLIRIQVLAGARSVAKADIKPYRKDVTAKLHAADPSRYNKLLSRQAEGKRRLRMIGEVSVPRDAFINVLKRPL